MKARGRNRAEIFIFSSFFLLLLGTSLVQSYTESEEEEEIQRNQFPDGFLFGAATSAYQALNYIDKLFFFLFFIFFPYCRSLRDIGSFFLISCLHIIFADRRCISWRWKGTFQLGCLQSFSRLEIMIEFYHILLVSSFSVSLIKI